eukprot:scaffold73030_cov60-Phaeocystis_antarctica.AAC.2
MRAQRRGGDEGPEHEVRSWMQRTAAMSTTIDDNFEEGVAVPGRSADRVGIWPYRRPGHCRGLAQT